MRYLQEQCRLLHKAEIADGIYNFTVSAPQIARLASIGQFVNLLCDGFQLRRPISLCGFDAELGVIRLVFEIRGKGTAWLAGLQDGDPLDIVGPLGHGFPLKDASQKAVLVGGGIGVPPLLPLARHFGRNATVITGFRNASAAILQDDIAACSAKAVLCTDDGSAGFHGFTTQALADHLNKHSCDVIYTCGPKIMMKLVADIARERKIPCYVSMEERMGCGVGACLGCVCKTKDGDKVKHTRVCLNGPVFTAEEVDWS